MAAPTRTTTTTAARAARGARQPQSQGVQSRLKAAAALLLLAMSCCAGVAAAQGFPPVGSGKNLEQLQERITALQEYYKEARDFLGIDDAVRISGYISKLQKLAIDYIDAFPLGEVNYFTTELALYSQILNLTYEIIRTTGSYIKFAGSILNLRIAIEEARREALALRQDASTSGSTAAGTAPADIPSLEGVEALASALEGSGAGMEALMALADQEEVVAQLLEEAQAVNEVVLPWALSGGPLAPLRLAANVMALTTAGLRSVNSFVAPAGLLGMWMV